MNAALRIRRALRRAASFLRIASAMAALTSSTRGISFRSFGEVEALAESPDPAAVRVPAQSFLARRPHQTPPPVERWASRPPPPAARLADQLALSADRR